MKIAVLLTLLPLLLVGGCADVAPNDAPPRELWLISLGHSESDEAEEQSHLADVDRLLLPIAMGRGVEVIVFTIGSDGYTSPRILSQVSFDTSDVDGDNPVLRDRLRDERRTLLRDETAAQIQLVPFSPASDVFGGIAAAQTLFDQYPREVPKTLISIGDQLANRPTGCVLATRDMSSPALRSALLQVCAPAPLDFHAASVLLVGAGYSLDDPIAADVATNLELLLREHYAASNACVVLYGQVLVAPGSACPSGPR